VSAIIDPIALLLNWVLQTLHGLTGSYLVAIVLLTVLVRALLHPLTRHQLKSMKAMQALTPQMEVLRRKYKDNPRQLNVEVMNLYRANKVNPFGGCLPLLLQLPVLYGLFALLRRPDLFGGELLFGVPLESTPSLEVLTQHPLLVLIPVLTGLTTYFQQMMSITDPQQARMFIFMPFLIAYFSLNFPLGLSVYWIISTAVYILEYYIVVGSPRRVGIAPPKEIRRRSGAEATHPDRSE
jgi:YidC/Oxa1 family membrane protein insertase